jgi:CBS-domain-containing membrane protein
VKVEQLMTRNVETCRSSDRMDRAAQIMWERDCGVVPVMAEGNGTARVIGMVTDRDICMAAYTQGRKLQDMPVASAMSRQVLSCRPTDSLAVALKVMKTNRVHRLPVVDQNEHVVGMLSLADIAREAQHEHGSMSAQLTDAAVAEAIEAISTSRSTGALVTTT